MQDTQPVTVGTNKIKINISKNVQLNKNSINSSESVDNNLAINSNDSVDVETHGSATTTTTTTITTATTINSVIENDTDHGENGSLSLDANEVLDDAAAASDDSNESEIIRDTDIEYEVKESMKSVQFQKQPVFKNGLETSGLCSIM